MLNDKERAAWLAGLKVGDEVCYQERGYERSYTIEKVVKKTPTGILFLGEACERWGNQGRQTRHHRTTWLEPVTEAVRATNARGAAISKVFRHCSRIHELERLPTETILKISQLLPD